MKKFEDLMSVKNEIENISASEAKDKLNDPNVQFIDVRDKESFSKGTIGNAIHMDKAFLEFYLAEGSPLENEFFKNNPVTDHVLYIIRHHSESRTNEISTKTSVAQCCKRFRGVNIWLNRGISLGHYIQYPRILFYYLR